MLKQIVSPFLQRYIRALDKSQLIKFLRFTMGLDIIAINKITVDFVKIDGMHVDQSQSLYSDGLFTLLG